MLRVGLTGDLGSGKSTVAQMLAERGAVVYSSDDMANAMMQPGQQVFAAIVAHFGETVLAADGTLDRRQLAALAFDPKHPRVKELNAIVHPAVIEAQAAQLAALAVTHPNAIAVVESALIFSTKYASGGSWQSRFDRILLVTALEETKIARFIERMATGRQLSAEERAALTADARQRLALQHTEDYASQCLVLHNDGDIEQLELQVEAIWRQLQSGALERLEQGARSEEKRFSS
jgi:dephospho-CoA kinase